MLNKLLLSSSTGGLFYFYEEEPFAYDSTNLMPKLRKK